MQTIFEITDDDGSISYLQMGDAPKHEHDEIHTHQISHAGERFNHPISNKIRQ